MASGWRACGRTPANAAGVSRERNPVGRWGAAGRDCSHEQPATRSRLVRRPEEDPRENGPSLGDERATLVEYLRYQRETLKLKFSGRDAADLARRSVEPPRCRCSGWCATWPRWSGRGSARGSPAGRTAALPVRR